MRWPKLDVVVGQGMTDRDLRRLQKAAVVGAAVLSAAGSSGCNVEVSGFESAQRERPTMQEEPHWCWAACLQAVLRQYGVDKDQRTIVTEVYGTPVNLPELSPAQIYHIVNDEIALPDGTTCVVRGRYFPGALLTAPVLYNELKAQRPVMAVYKTGPQIGHAVVIYAATFSAFGPITIKYFDPTPGKGLGEVSGTEIASLLLRWFTIRANVRAA
jgi:hypothetical protein